MRFHVAGLPHTETTREFSWCAYTTKVRRFCNMMHGLGHEVFLYAGANNEAACTELITLVKPVNDPDNIPSFDSEIFGDFAESAIPEIRERIEPKDFICLIGGRAQKPIADAFPEQMSVEFGIGYSGVFAEYKVFESYAWMHMIYGRQDDPHNTDGRFFDAVIPNYFDVDEFPAGDGGGGYLLYLGRLVDRKGWSLAVEVAGTTGHRLVVAGGPEPEELPPFCEYVGMVGPKQRARLLGNAIATMMPTLYIEPFGGVHVESMLCGTPVITTDWGAFTETVDPSVGVRCRTYREFCEATETVKSLDRAHIRDYAIGRFSTEVVAPQYESYFERLLTLWGKGFYER